MHGRSHWLNRERLRVYPRLILAVFAVLGIAWFCVPAHRAQFVGKPFGDFVLYWTASRMAEAGHAADAYSTHLLLQAEKAAFPQSVRSFSWYYPPTFYLLLYPLGRLSFNAGYALFELSTLACYVFTLRRITRNATAMWCLAAFSGMWVNFLGGQNAFFTATLAAAALLCLRKRPALAGVFIGLLAIKPHLAVLFPVALIAVGAWSTLLVAALTAVAFTAVSTAVLGTATLTAFLGSLGSAKVALETGVLTWAKMPTVFVSLRLLNAPTAWAYAAHAVVALAATIAVWHVWRRSNSWQLRGAVLMTATFFISPYLFDYDLAWLAFPIAWLALNGMENGWLPGEREVLVAAWLLPMAMALAIQQFHLPIAPLVLGALLWVIVRRARAEMTVPSANLAAEHTMPPSLELLPSR